MAGDAKCVRRMLARWIERDLGIAGQNRAGDALQLSRGSDAFSLGESRP